VKDDASPFLQENIMTIYLEQNMKVHFSFFGGFRALSLTRTTTYVEQTRKAVKKVENASLDEDNYILSSVIPISGAVFGLP